MTDISIEQRTKLELDAGTAIGNLVQAGLTDKAVMVVQRLIPGAKVITTPDLDVAVQDLAATAEALAKLVAGYSEMHQLLTDTFASLATVAVKSQEAAMRLKMSQLITNIVPPAP